MSLSILLSNDCMPSAVIIQGDIANGRQELEAFLQIACCEEQTNCGKCSGCLLIKSGNHPDIYSIAPSAVGHAIKIEQIREVQHIAYQTPCHAAQQFIIIYHADSLNIFSANALLKVLEEPSLKTHFILLAENAAHLPKTVLSRCFVIDVGHDLAPDVIWHEKFAADLKLFVEDKKDLTQLLQIFASTSIDDSLLFLQYFCANVIKSRVTLQIAKADFALTVAIPLALWWSFWDTILIIKQQIRNGVNFQEQLLLSRLFLILKGKN